MHGHYECKNAYEKQQTTQNKKTSRSNKKTYQEQLEDHEEHYECMNFRKMQLTPNKKNLENHKNQKYFFVSCLSPESCYKFGVNCICILHFFENIMHP